MTYPLYHLIVHPKTSHALTNRAMITFSLILKRQAALANAGESSRAASPDTDLDIGNIVQTLHNLGARRQCFPADLQALIDPDGRGDMPVDGKGSADGKERSGSPLRNQKENVFTPQERSQATFRLLSILELFIETR